MSITTDEIKSRLANEDHEFRRLSDAHAEHERRLDELSRQGFLTDEEQLEEVRLKKEKLYLKDKMYEFIRRYKARAEDETREGERGSSDERAEHD